MLDINDYLKLVRADDEALHSYIGEIKEIYFDLEPSIKAFLPEQNRFIRLKGDLNDLRKKFPEIDNRPPLYGLLMGVKDIFHVDGYSTKAGSKVPSSELIGSESSIVTKLKNLGVLILGKTVTTEFAYFSPGPTRNPFNLKHTPGGSSSGSAAAVSAGMVQFALGSQTIGSTIRPASYCGVFGYKPTYGRVPMDGVIPLAPSVDTIGFFTQSPIGCSNIIRYLINDWDSRLISTKKPVLGIPTGPYLTIPDPEMVGHFDYICNRLRVSGYRIIDIPVFDNVELISRHHNNLVAYETSKIHETWFTRHSSVYHPKTIELIKKGLKVSELEYQTALESRLVLKEELLLHQKQSGIDLWLSPPAKGAAPSGLISTGDPIMNLPWTHCGFPTVNLPAGLNNRGLPLGLQITGAYNQDEALLKWVEDISNNLIEPAKL